MKRIVVSATEASADRIGAELVEALAARTRVEVRGLAGPRMIEAGVLPLPGTRMDPVMGGIEVLGHLRTLRANSAALLRAIDERPDVLVVVDAPDFHLPIARAARRKGVKVVGYVSPQLWAWRPGRARSVAAAFDRLLCLFSFEPSLYAGFGLDARWVGHPVVDRVGPSAREEGVVAIFPGSRRAEIGRLLRPFLAAVGALGPREVLLPVAATLSERELRASVERLGGPIAERVRFTTTQEALGRASRALTKSGTVTLELALAGIPFVVAHRVSPLTYWLGRLLVRGVRHLALPNILLGREAIREYVQIFTPDDLACSTKDAAEPPVDEIRARLGPPGVSGRAADAVMEVLGGGQAGSPCRP